MNKQLIKEMHILLILCIDERLQFSKHEEIIIIFRVLEETVSEIYKHVFWAIFFVEKTFWTMYEIIWNILKNISRKEETQWALEWILGTQMN